MEIDLVNAVKIGKVWNSSSVNSSREKPEVKINAGFDYINANLFWIFHLPSAAMMLVKQIMVNILEYILLLNYAVEGIRLLISTIEWIPSQTTSDAEEPCPFSTTVLFCSSSKTFQIKLSLKINSCQKTDYFCSQAAKAHEALILQYQFGILAKSFRLAFTVSNEFVIWHPADSEHPVITVHTQYIPRVNRIWL